MIYANAHQRLARPQFLILLLAAACLLAGNVLLYYHVGGAVSIRSRAIVKPYVFPHGGRALFPRYRLVALYGTPSTPELGALGEQPRDEAIARVEALAAHYRPLTHEYVMPSLEIIATVASAYPTDDGDYSYAVDEQVLANWITAAKARGVYVVLDIQPGRTDFLTQARSLQPLLEQPNVGLALDPEWRLGQDQLPLLQIGSVGIDEVNRTAAWLADMTKREHLPQKLFLLHQFRLDMLPDRERLDTSRSELAYAVQMDGQGSQPAKLDTWAAVTAQPPAGVRFGWKNFYKKDAPMRSPVETMALNPTPWYISYQ